VYVFYDPSLPHLQLGRYTALREIQWVQQASITRPQLRWYYMGFYIHTCQKMRYKGEYEPSQLLCPVTHTWVDLDADCRRILDKHRFACLADPSRNPAEATEPPPPTDEERLAQAAALIPPTPPSLSRQIDLLTRMSLVALSTAGTFATVDMLTPHGQRVVEPIIRETVTQLTPPVARRVLIGF
jgi:hypothetical protein